MKIVSEWKVRMKASLIRFWLIAAFLLVFTLPVSAQSTCGATVTVASGDNLARIAQRCGTTVQALLAANPQITDPNRLFVGQVLTIPGQTGGAGSFVVAIYPLSGLPGSSITVIVNGLPPNAPIQVGLGPVQSEFVTLQQLTSDPFGGLQTVVTVPNSAGAGQQWVVGAAPLDGSAGAISRPFVVSGSTTPPTATPGAVLFDRANIYMIALNDAGQTGQAVGCGDSAIPVLRTFQPTVAPLTAALQILLAQRSQYYGESGLYNALYQSSLALEGVNIVNREAIINLVGQLVIGGVCDAPRLQAQIELTALQFATIDRVTINVNGQPLSQLLSSQG
ncbi:MAG: LysM peptidoglycan-binding domain-containing protein [Anaerolinea sp.]|nr:LysM peptidoglycan-binding domain-containing protein [Anaerolinea sp.]